MFSIKRQMVLVLVLSLLKHKVAYATNWPTQRYSELNVYLQGFTFDSSRVNTIFECYRMCEQNILCASINMNLMNNKCELKFSTKTRHPEKTFHQHNMIYMETREDIGAPGSRPDTPIPSCKKLKEDDSQAKSGVYWMKFNEPSSAPFQVFCDMTTDGGGWNLVYSYTFTQYSKCKFAHASNSVTPIPNWPVDTSTGTWVPQSTTTPLSESSHSAMDFALWKKIGNEFLLKSNITNWVACVEGIGSIVNFLQGSVSCRVVKAITATCTATAPNTFRLSSSGPIFQFSGNSGSSLQFSFDGRTDKYFPTHDPCAKNSAKNHLINVANPGGALYIR